MAGKHVFVDESKRGDYVVVVAAVSTGNLEATRRELRTLLLPGQRALHFKDEREGRRKKILARMVELPVTAGVYVRRGGDAVSARRACLEAIVEDLSGRAEVERMVLELADGDLAADKRTLLKRPRSGGHR